MCFASGGKPFSLSLSLKKYFAEGVGVGGGGGGVSLSLNLNYSLCKIKYLSSSSQKNVLLFRGRPPPLSLSEKCALLQGVAVLAPSPSLPLHPLPSSAAPAV